MYAELEEIYSGFSGQQRQLLRWEYWALSPVRIHRLMKGIFSSTCDKWYTFIHLLIFIFTFARAACQVHQTPSFSPQ